MDISVKEESEGWQDIPLFACTSKEIEDARYHVMKFGSTRDIDIVNNFTRPVRLHRKDPRNIQFQLTRQEIDKRKQERLNESMALDRALPDGAVLGPDGTPLLDADGNPIKAGSNFSGLSLSGQPYADMSQIAPDGGARKPKRNMFKRKTRQINPKDEKKRKLRYEEYYPWVIEDYDGQNVFVGNYEAGSSELHHVLFVFDKDGFKMVPAEKVYRFTPRNKYATLTLEEAEAKMEKNLAVPRWLMKHMEDKQTLELTPDQRYRNLGNGFSGGSAGGGARAPLGMGAGNPSNGRLRTVLGGASTADRDSDHDDLDFDEEFADDEEAPIVDGDEEENKLSERKIKKEMLKATAFDGHSEDDLDDLFETDERKVDKEGKKLRKVLNKTEGGVYDLDDDDAERNPYVLQSDLESNDDLDDLDTRIKREREEDEARLLAAGPRTIFAHDVGDGFVLVKAPREFLAGFPPGEWVANGRKRLAPASPRPTLPGLLSLPKRRSPSPPLQVGDLDDAGPDNALVTIKEVLDIVRKQPLTTRELLMGLKTRVSTHRENKQRIISIVKQNLQLVDGKLVLKE